MERLPKRSEVPEELTWNLSDIFESDEAWAAENEALKNEIPDIVSYRGKLGESAENLLNYFKKSDELSVRISRLHGYASCKSDQDTANSFYLDMKNKAVSTIISVIGAAAFANPEIMEIPDERLNLFYAVQPELAGYERALYSIRRRKEHILSEKEEALLAAAEEIGRAPGVVAEALRNADLRYPDVADSKGQLHQLTAGTFVLLEQSPDRVLRENAFRAAYGRLGEMKNTIASSLNAQFRQLMFFSEARKYPDTLSASLDSNEVPVPVYLNLIDTVHANLEKMHRYVSLRKRMLGLSELHMYDVYVPIVADADRRIAWEEAKETVLAALSVLGEDYTDLLRKGFEERWIDVLENEGKRSGAYSSGSSRPHPYVLLNHKDNLDSMFTLAHEMGHALHSYHSTENQPVAYADYVIFVAEVASTCNEILLMRYLLDRTSDKKERAYLLNHFLEEFKGTLFRQTMFAEFELWMGRTAESGVSLTADALCGKYLELNKAYFGPEMISDDEIALEWARIPHFFYNYYVFQYATGFSAAVAIANRILSEGAAAVEDYKRFLSGGSSTDPISLLKIAGVDMSSPVPVESALAFFGELVDEFSELMR